MTLTDLWRLYRTEQTRLLNESPNPHLSVAELEQAALGAVLAEAGVQLDDEPITVGSAA